MKLSEEQRADLCRETRDASIAYLEDIEYIRSLSQDRNTARGEIRRLSIILRRLLLDGDISKIASPRLGKVLISAPDNSAIEAGPHLRHLVLFLSGRAKVFGWSGAIMAYENPEIPSFTMPDIDLEKRTQVPIKKFLTQKVLYCRGAWVNRRSIIQYVAHVTSGAHSRGARTEEEKVLARIRGGNYLRKDPNGGIHLALFDHGTHSESTELIYAENSIDLTLVELLATASFLAESPDLRKLEEIIKEELRTA